MTLTVEWLGTPVRCDGGCGGLIGTLYNGEVHIRAGKQIVIGRELKVTCKACGRLHLLGVKESEPKEITEREKTTPLPP